MMFLLGWFSSDTFFLKFAESSVSGKVELGDCLVDLNTQFNVFLLG